MSLTLCGFNITYEHLEQDRCTASRIHTAAQNDLIHQEVGSVIYTMYRVNRSTVGIIEAINLDIPLDLQKNTISKSRQIEELNILVADLQKIENVARTGLATPEIYSHWKRGIVQNFGTTFSIAELCDELSARSQQIQNCIAFLRQRIEEGQAPIAAQVNESMSGAVEQTVPIDIGKLIAEYIEIE